MKRESIVKRIITLFLAVSLTATCVGCGSSTATESSEEVPEYSQETSAPEETTTGTEAEEQQPAEISPEEIAPPVDTTAEPVLTPDEVTDEYGLTEQQRNSFSMLYYLAITAEKIRISKDNRLLLDDIYTSLLNDINPGAIDETTQEHLKNLRDIIKGYINISVKRERLQYIYNQDKAATIRSAVPNPLAILSMTNSFNWKKLATSVAYNHG